MYIQLKPTGQVVTALLAMVFLLAMLYFLLP